MALFDSLRTDPPGGRPRWAASLAVSALVHGSVLGWVAIPALRDQPARSLYDQVIKPNQKRIVWYHLQAKLPDVTPTAPEKEEGPLRAEVKHPQTILARDPGAERSTQRIWLPEPEIAASRELPSPNLLAFNATEPRPLRDFQPPRELPRTDPPASLPEPRVSQWLELRPPPVDTATARPQPKLFAPPPQAPPPPATLPEAPEPAASVAITPPPVQTAVARPLRAFTSPAARSPDVSSFLPAPETTITVTFVGPPAAAAPALAVRPAPRQFIPPELGRLAETPGAALPAPGSEIASAARPIAGDAMPSAARAPLVVPPANAAAYSGGAVALPDAPELRASAVPSAAIVGLYPAPHLEAPVPAGSRRADFSAGPELRPDGSTGGTNPNALIRVPGLLVRNSTPSPQPTLVARVLEAPTSTANLVAATRAAPPHTLPAPAATGPAEPRAARVTSSPDPHLEGRAIYSFVVQMPNITSWSGSWLLWFAERDAALGETGDLRPPLPLRKVDPKYVASAAAERVEGKVRLRAIIRKSGEVDTVTILHGLDPRLDRTAMEAMLKWQFLPASRDGVPVDVDAVVEIPFRLAPLAKVR